MFAVYNQPSQPSQPSQPGRARLVVMDRYGTEHSQLRDMWKRRLGREGVVACGRCGSPIYAGPVDRADHVDACKVKGCNGECWYTWDLGHANDGVHYNGPEHQCCNRAAGGRNGARAVNADRWRPTHRDW